VSDTELANVGQYSCRHDRSYKERLSSHAKFIAAIARGERSFRPIDHETGRVCRTPPPITRFLYRYRLASLGVNLNFAPVLDIDSNPNNPVCFAARMTNDGKPGKCLPHARTPFASSVCAVATLQWTVRDVIGRPSRGRVRIGKITESGLTAFLICRQAGTTAR
jgi:hypothetical protein